MRDDFSLIARDFLIHEYANVKDHEMLEYLNIDPGVCWPEKMFERFVLNLMMNAVKCGSEYTKAFYSAMVPLVTEGLSMGVLVWMLLRI